MTTSPPNSSRHGFLVEIFRLFGIWFGIWQRLSNSLIQTLEDVKQISVYSMPYCDHCGRYIRARESVTASMLAFVCIEIMFGLLELDTAPLGKRLFCHCARKPDAPRGGGGGAGEDRDHQCA